MSVNKITPGASVAPPVMASMLIRCCKSVATFGPKGNAPTLLRSHTMPAPAVPVSTIAPPVPPPDNISCQRPAADVAPVTTVRLKFTRLRLPAVREVTIESTPVNAMVYCSDTTTAPAGYCGLVLM